MTKYIVPLLLLLASTSGVSVECATSRCYTDSYNSVDPESLPVLARVEEIYSQLCKTIGSRKARRSRLVVINSDGYPWAVALADNTVVMTSGIIRKIYQDDDLELGDARAAFILGHELSHLETEDLFHHRAFVANATPDTADQIWLRPKPAEELRADLRGYTYATVAGYKTNRLIDDDNNFFENWLPGVSGVNSKTHPDHETRSRFLRAGFDNILRDVPYYQFATALAHFGYYRDAQYLLEDFLNHVETREAYSNLGYVHLQRARESMPVRMAYKYWFPTLLEPASGLDIPRERGLFDEELPPRALKHLQDAEQYLLHAIRMDDSQLTPYINLAVVYLYMPDKVHRAYAAIEDARRTRLGRSPVVRNQLESMYQIIRIQDDYDGGDRWPHARDTMAALAETPAVADNLLYNFARMLDDRGRDDTAKAYWQKLYQNLDYLPPAYRLQVCHRLRKEQCLDQNDTVSPWAVIDERLEKDIRYPEVQSFLRSHWNAGSFPAKLLPDLKAQVFYNQQGDSLLALDNHVEMMIFRNVPSRYRSLSRLQAEFGNPLAALPLNDGQVLSFSSSWSAYIGNSEVREIWISELSAGKQSTKTEN